MILQVIMAMLDFITFFTYLKLCSSLYTNEPPDKFLEVQSLSDRYPASESDYRINCTNCYVSKIIKLYISTYRVSQKKWYFVEKLSYLSSNSKRKCLGYFGKFIMGTEILKIEEEMTEKMKPQVVNPPPKMGRIFCSQNAFTWPS